MGDWLRTDRFEILAKASDPVDNPLLMKMLQSLLAERFHLALHSEVRPIPVYLLSVSPKGAKLQESHAEEAVTNSTGNNSELRMDARKITMAHLAEVLARYMDRPVVDRTGIAGAYDLKLEWARGDSSETLPSIFTAVQEQLGLRMTADRAPADVLVIDQVEKPSGN
ncbi:MAG TPA: TIGR03435 family protein [Bryobacteraceae bacterium]